MPIGAFISQPTANGISAAYRPVVLRVSATNTDATAIPPVVYCDIYFNDVYYKTISKSQYSKLNVGVNTEWEFDIQDAAQEYLRAFLGAHGAIAIVQATTVITKCQCKFRSSGLDVNGFIDTEDLAPVQGTGGTDPVAGTGTASNTFYIVNATLQHEDNQSLATHLFYFKNRTWTADAHPLSHRPDGYKIGPSDSDVFPIIYTGAGTFKKLRLKYRLCGQDTFSTLEINVSGAPACSAVISDPVVEPNITGWLVNWGLVSGAPAKYFVSTPAVLGGAPQETTDTEFQYLFAELPVGEHVITVRPLCLIEGEYYFGAAKTVTITVDACVGVGIVGAPELPDAAVGVIYAYDFSLSGSAPFVLDNVVKPVWMDIEIIGNTVQITGNPDSTGDAGEDIPVSFDILNCGGGNSVHFEDLIDVAEEPEGCVAADGSPEFPGAQAGNHYSYSFPLSGTPPFALDSATKPAWMNVSVVGSNVFLSGLPGPGDVDPEVHLEINVSNCVDDIVSFEGDIAVLP